MQPRITGEIIKLKENKVAEAILFEILPSDLKYYAETSYLDQEFY